MRVTATTVRSHTPLYRGHSFTSRRRCMSPRAGKVTGLPGDAAITAGLGASGMLVPAIRMITRPAAGEGRSSDVTA